VFGDAAASPETRKASRRINPLFEAAETKVAQSTAPQNNKKDASKKASGKDEVKKTAARRKRDLANEKAGNHLALVSWLGVGTKDGIRNDRTYYDGFTRDGQQYRKGDCVFCLPERTTEDMYLAQIQRCFEDADKEMYMECCWFMTQDEVRAWGGVLPSNTAEHEIFLGTSVDVNPIAALEGFAPVYTLDRFLKLSANGQISAQGDTSDPDERVLFARKCYVPTHGYNPKSKKASERKPGTFIDLKHSQDAGFIIQWPSARKSKTKK
jgi:hypothetical protein